MIYFYLLYPIFCIIVSFSIIYLIYKKIKIKNDILKDIYANHIRKNKNGQFVIFSENKELDHCYSKQIEILIKEKLIEVTESNYNQDFVCRLTQKGEEELKRFQDIL